MNREWISATFAQEDDLLGAVRAVRAQGWEVVDVYAPYAVHGLEEALGWPRSRLPAACLVGGAAGVGFAAWFQYWTTAWDWPLNVGGRPWNSLPAFVPVIFESMVLLGGFALVFAWLVRCRLYPGKRAQLPAARVTDDRFVVTVHTPYLVDGAAAVRQLLLECRAVRVHEEKEEEVP